MSYQLICMSFDGEYQTERGPFTTISEAWEHSDDMGSRWYFYPFHFVVTESGKTIAAACDLLDIFKGRRVSTVRRKFAEVAALPEAQGLDSESFAFLLLEATL